MSLINQMLRDLDARRAPAADRAQLQDMVHVAHKRRRSFAMGALALVTLGAAAGGAWYWFFGSQLPFRPAAMPATQLPVPASAPQVVPPARPAASASPAAVAVAANSAPQLSAGAQVSATAAPVPATPATDDAPPTAKGTTKPRLADTPPRPFRQAAPALAGTSAVPAVAAPGKGTFATGAEPSIEKRPHMPLANEAAETEYSRALAALRRGATAEAVTSLELTLRLDSVHVLARQVLLSLMLRQQQWGDAQRLAEEGLKIDPTQTGWAITLARLQMENGKLPEATETLARHARYAERNADYQAFQALLLQKQKRYHEACDRYIEAVKLKPGEARWWYGLGVSLEADERPQEAREAFLKARDAGNLPPELTASLKYHLR